MHYQDKGQIWQMYHLILYIQDLQAHRLKKRKEMQFKVILNK